MAGSGREAGQRLRRASKIRREGKNLVEILGT